MSTVTPDAPATRLTPLHWLIIVISAIGFAFDSYVLLMLPLDRAAGAQRSACRCRRPARWSTTGPASSSTCRRWPAASSGCSAATSPTCSAGAACWCGASCSTRFRRSRRASRRRSRGCSIWRCGTFVGVCVEFVAAVAWLSELFPNRKQREAIVGYTQAFGSFGGIMVTARLLPVGHLRPSPCRRSTADTKRGATR